MKTIPSLLFIASIGLNAAFLFGCKSVHDFCYGDPCKVSPSKKIQPIISDDGGKEALAAIADKLGLPYENRDVRTLKSDILVELSNQIPPPNLFDDASFEKMAKDLDDYEAEYMREYQSHIKSLQGKRIIVITPKD